MKRGQVKVFGIIGVVMAVVAVWFFFLRAPEQPAGGGKAGTAARSPGQAQATEGSEPAVEASGPRGALRWEWERDREGPLRLDGQVVNEAGEPVNDAVVAISTEPAAVTRTQADGSFHFDKLISRTYSLRARTAAQVGSAHYKLTATSDPVVVRMSGGAAVEVSVTDESDRPVRGAKLSTRDAEELGALAPTAVTDEQGRAILRGVESGWTVLKAEAEGFAPAELSSMVGAPAPDGKPVAELTFALSRGVAVSGKVVDESGMPVSGARVSFNNRGVSFGSWRRGSAKTDEQGAFRFPVLAPGSYELDAMDGEHAPGNAVALDVASQPLTDVRLTLSAGGVVSGSVVDRAGAPVPFALVRSAPVPDSDPRNLRRVFPRQATTDASGKFELRGLARAALQLRAEGETATSAVVEVSLVEAAKRDDVKVVLDVEGSISGVVVDDKGEPVPEMEIVCFPDFRAGGKIAGLALGGSYSTTSDGSGAFTLRGLPEGNFRMWVERPGATSRFGAADRSKVAKTGDRDVRLVIKPFGRIIGKIATRDGRPPALAKISLSMLPPVVTRDGTFVMDGIEPTKYALVVRGPDFAELGVDDVEVTAGKTTDLGTLTVTLGRRITGVVVDGQKRPVAGARVRAGRFLVFESGASRGGARVTDERMGVNSTVSDAQGAFSLSSSAPDQPAQVAAETADGRSEVVTVAPGEGAAAPVTLQLRGLGSIGGFATVNGKPADEVHINAHGKEGRGSPGLFATGNADGSYVIDRLVEGTYVVTAQWPGALAPATGEVKVESGKRSKLDLDIKSNNGPTLAVEVSALPGHQIDSAMLALFEGAYTAATGKELMAGSRQPLGRAHWSGYEEAAFPDLKPGAYTLCGLPMNEDRSDPEAMRRLFDNMDKLAVYCKPVTVTAAPAKQTFALGLPAMKPLPKAPPTKK